MAQPPVLRWNDDKKHRCPACHAVAIDIEVPKSFAIYECCRCHVLFTRWPRLARLLPFRGMMCSEHRFEPRQ
jgi:hypothetical protein